MNRELQEAFLTAVENAVSQCLMPVPVVPLMVLDEALVRICVALDAEIETQSVEDRLLNVCVAANKIEWSFYPPEENQVSYLALTNNTSLMALADALRAYREAEAEPQVETPLSVPHWEAVTPALMAVDA